MHMNLPMKAAAVLLLSAFTLIGSGCVTQSRKEMKAAAEKRWSDTRSGIMFSVAQQRFDAGELEKAKKTLNQAIRANPDNAKFHVLDARISLEQGSLERAYRKLERAVQLNEEHDRAHYFMGVIFQRWQRYDQALAKYEKAYELRPDDPAALVAISETLVKLERPEEAIERLKSKMNYFENNPEVRVALGRIHMLEARYDKAVRWFREASVLSAQDDAIVEHLAMAEYAAGQHGDAIQRFESLLGKKDYQGRDDLRLALGDCYMATGNPVKARAAFLEVTKNREGDVNAWIKLAQAAWAVEDRIRLQEAGRRVRELAPNRYEGQVIQGMIERSAGRTGAAVRHFERAAEMAPSHVLPLLMKGMALEDSGDRDAARQAYQRARQVAPNDPRPTQLLSALNAS